MQYRGLTIPIWGTTSRPSSPKSGEIGFNDETDDIEIYSGSSWKVLTDILDAIYLKLDASNDPVTGDLLLKPTANSTTTFQIQPSGSTTPVLNVDTTNYMVGIGTATPAQKLDILTGTIRYSTPANAGACTSALAGAGAGNLTNGAYTYKITFVYAGSEKRLGTASNTTTVVDATTNGKIALTSIPTSSDTSVTARNIYRTTAGGSTYYFVAQIADNSTTTYTDNIADSALGTQGTVYDRINPFYIDTNQRLRVAGGGTTAGFDFQGGNLICSDLGLDQAGTQNARFGTFPYTLGQNPFFCFLSRVDGTDNTANFGGGTSLGQAATVLKFYTAAALNTTTGTERMRIDSSGNVGIGTAAPTAKLHVVGNADTQQLIVKQNATQTSNTLEIQNSSATILGYWNGTAIVLGNATTAGSVIFGSPSAGSSLIRQSVDDGSVIFQGASTWQKGAYMQFYGGTEAYGDAGNIKLNYGYYSGVGTASKLSVNYLNNSTITNVLTILSSGYVGIGTASPSTKLHVNSGDVTIDDTSGAEKVTNGTFTSDLSGWTAGASWQWSAGTASKFADGTDTLSQDVGVVAGSLYKVVFTSVRTAGTWYVNLGGVDIGLYGGSYTQTAYVIARTTGALTFTPSNTARFTLDNVSVTLLSKGKVTADNYIDSKVGYQINGVSVLTANGINNFCLGVNSGAKITTGATNMVFGPNSGTELTTGSSNSFVGAYSGISLVGGSSNTYIGVSSGRLNVSGSNNTAVGSSAGYSNTGSGSVFLGCSAGYYETASNKLFIDNVARASEADGRVKALIYGVFASTVASQSLTFNSGLTTNNGAVNIVGGADTQQLIVKANATQTTNLTEWQNSSGTLLSGVGPTGNFGIGVTPQPQKLYVNGAVSDTASYTNLISSTNVTTTGNTAYSLNALSFTSQKLGGFNYGNIIGVTGNVYHNATAGTTSSMIGFYVNVGLLGDTSAGTIGNAYSYYAAAVARVAGSTTTIGSTYGMYVADISASYVTASYGLYVVSLANSGTNYAIYTNAGDCRIGDDLIQNAADSDKHWWGAGKDMSIYYDGTSGYVKTSDVAASDLHITCGTDKTLVLDESVYQDANVGGLVLRTGGTAPGVVQWLDNDGDATGLYTIGFADGEQGSGVIELPHDYKEGTNIVFHIHYGINDAPTGTDKIRFDLIYNVQRDGTTFVDATTIDSTDVTVDTQYKTGRVDFSAIDGTNFKIGDQFNFTIKRTTAVGDAYAGEVLAQTIGFHYEVDTLGSRQIGTK